MQESRNSETVRAMRDIPTVRHPSQRLMGRVRHSHASPKIGSTNGTKP